MASYRQFTLADLKARLTERVGNNSTFWIDVEKQDAVNEAISVWQAMTGEWNFGFSISAISGQVFYTVPHQIVSAQRVKYGTAPLTAVTVYELDYATPGWQDAADGTPLYWAPVGFNEIAVYPTAASGTLTIDGIQESPRLMNDADFINLGEEEVNVILDYGQHFLTFKEGSVELQSSMALAKNFLAAAGLRNSRIQAVASYHTFMGEVREEGERLPRTVSNIGAR